MIIFKDISGHTHPAVGTIERKHSLNGEKSLTGTLYRGDEVLDSIDKGWGLEFDGEPYVVTYFERNDNDNSIEFDAVHHFFWRMIKLGFYEEWNGSHSLSVYLDAIFKDSGYKYADNTSAKAFEKENWGMANRLSLFNDVIKSIGAEFEIHGNMVSIFPKIGTDLSTIVRHGFNLSDMTIENNSGSFATYGEGFGAYANQQELTGPRLHVIYKSPLYEIYGRLDAEVIDDQRYKVKDNLLNEVKKSVDNSFVVSIKLSLYDLQKAGYPYKMASVGDWLTVIDEKLNFQKRVRIIDIQDSFDANDERTGYTVTCGDLNAIDSYDYGVASVGQRVNDAVKQSQEASSAAILAQISADGKNTIYRLNDINELPTNANEGDLSFVTSGSGTAIYVYTKKEDGSFYWEKRVDPDIGEQIDFSVDQVLSESKEYTNGVKSELSKDIADTTAQAQLMADIAESNAKSEAQAAVKQTNDALVKAKNDLSSNLSKEINERTNAVNAVNTRTDNAIKQAKEDLNSSINQETINRTKDIADANAKAQSFADKAKSDAISAATTADSNINKKIDDTADSINSTINQNKVDADGKIKTVSTTATHALDGLSKKVEKTDYDQRTGDLDTKINQTKDTAEQSARDIVAIKKDNDTQNSKINNVIDDASQSKRTISDIQSKQGTQSADISTLQQRADGFDATVTKVNGLSVGGRNLLLASANMPNNLSGWNSSNKAGDTYQGLTIAEVNYAWGGPKYKIVDLLSRQVINDKDTYTLSAYVRNTSDNDVEIGFYGTDNITAFTAPNGNLVSKIKAHSDWTRISVSFSFINLDKLNNTTIRFEPRWNVTNGAIGQAGLKLENGNLPSPYTVAPEDVESSISKAQQTADQASLNLSNYKTDANGRITKAQADININTSEIKKKVDTTTYDAKTEQLTNGLNSTTQTANQSKQDIISIKTDNTSRDSKINTITKDVDGTKQDISNIKIANGTQDSKIAIITSDVGGLNAKYLSTQNQVNDLQQVNLLTNTEFSPDYGSWAPNKNSAGISIDNFWKHGTSNNIVLIRNNGSTDWIHLIQNVPMSSNQVVSFSTIGKLNATYDGQLYIHVRAYDSKNNSLGDLYKVSIGSTNGFQLFKSESMSIPDKTSYLQVALGMYKNANVAFSQPMLVIGNTIGNYIPGQYNNNDKVATISAGLDGLSGQFTQYKTSNDGMITTMKGNINANTSAINTKVSLDTFNQKTGEINSRFSQVENDTKAVTTTVGNIQSNLGATNLFTNSEFDKTSGYDTSGNVTLNGLDHKDLVDGNYNGTISVTATSAGYQGYWGKHIPVIGGGKYAMSVLAHYVPNGVANGYAGLDVCFYDKDKKRISAGGGTGKRWTNATSPWWNKLTAENVVAPDNAVTVQVSLLVNNAGAGQKADFSQPMVTATEKLQPYTPSPVDFTSDIAQVKVAAEFISNWVKDSSGNLSSTFQNALSRVSIVSGSEFGNSIVRQTQTQITQAVVANNGQVINIINQVAGKTLIGAENKIILDAPTVTVSGKAWMDGAVIKNASIGTAQIGTIDASAANIVNINANNITGNATQFVKTQWNNAYGGNVSIDGGRMRVSYGTTQIEYNSGGMVVEYEGDNVGSIGTSISNGVKGLSFFINDQTHHFMSWAQRSRGDKDYSPMMTWAGYNVAQTMNTNKDGGFRIWDNIDFDTYDQTTSVTRWNSNTKVRFMTTDVRFIGQFKTGGERYFKTTGKDINSATQGKRYAYGFSNGGESAGIYFDQGNIWFECYGETHSLSEIFYKINKVS
ncbi:phage tail protein [Leuconostoc fallax]|uniref:phage tail protein n=1 Tax=Leuconostoc fallax TaxID=1251 RepID=UPI001C1E8E13|nr:phage tail protein [Leuconostoc fallax]MBU7455837.1 hypothetical protein [Leuconostoc fallax]